MSSTVPFGLAQAPAHFQKLINEVLADCNFAMGYLDDIIIFSKTEEEHLEHLGDYLQLTTRGRTETQTPEMQFLQETHPVPWTPDIG